MKKGMLSAIIGFYIGYEGAGLAVHVIYWILIAGALATRYIHF